MTGRWALIGNCLLALAIVGFASACGGDDDDTSAGSGGSTGGSGSGGMGGSGGSGGSTGGSGGSMSTMITAAMCVSNSMKETPTTPVACLTCICGQDPKTIDGVDAAGWKLLECIAAKCDGVGVSPCATMAGPNGCGDLTAAGARTEDPTIMSFHMCMKECGILDMSGADAGTEDAGL